MARITPLSTSCYKLLQRSDGVARPGWPPASIPHARSHRTAAANRNADRAIIAGGTSGLLMLSAPRMPSQAGMLTAVPSRLLGA
eukprot:scaffold9330_cov117-Isochrysis_galbana.AAC.9